MVWACLFGPEVVVAAVAGILAEKKKGSAVVSDPVSRTWPHERTLQSPIQSSLRIVPVMLDIIVITTFLVVSYVLVSRVKTVPVHFQQADHLIAILGNPCYCAVMGLPSFSHLSTRAHKAHSAC